MLVVDVVDLSPESSSWSQDKLLSPTGIFGLAMTENENAHRIFRTYDTIRHDTSTRREWKQTSGTHKYNKIMPVIKT